MKYYCQNCKEIFEKPKLPHCPHCHTVLDLMYNYAAPNHVIKSFLSQDKITHWKYHDLMPINYHNTQVLSMHEGGTPLMYNTKLPMNPSSQLYFKCEFMNPTGSFKDRASALELTLAQGYSEIVVATTGNMGASLSAYAALSDKKIIVFIPEGIHNNKIEQMQMYGAIINYVPGNYDDALLAAEKYYLDHPHSYLAGDYGVRIEGTKSIGYEISEQLEWEVPDYIVVPVGNGTLLYSIWRAFEDLNKIHIVNKMPRMIGVKSNDPKNTIASAIACPNPTLDLQIKNVADQIITVSDDEIMMTRSILAKNGIFVEPGGATSYAGYRKLNIGGTIVLLLTGHGLKGI